MFRGSLNEHCQLQHTKSPRLWCKYVGCEKSYTRIRVLETALSRTPQRPRKLSCRFPRCSKSDNQEARLAVHHRENTEKAKNEFARSLDVQNRTHGKMVCPTIIEASMSCVQNSNLTTRSPTSEYKPSKNTSNQVTLKGSIVNFLGMASSTQEAII